MRIYNVMSASLRVLVYFCVCAHTLAYTEFSPSRTNVYPYHSPSFNTAQTNKPIYLTNEAVLNAQLHNVECLLHPRLIA